MVPELQGNCYGEIVFYPLSLEGSFRVHCVTILSGLEIESCRNISRMVFLTHTTKGNTCGLHKQTETGLLHVY